MRTTYLGLHIAVLLAGFTGVFGKLISLNEGLLVWYRVFFSAVFLFIFILLSGKPRPSFTKEKLNIGLVGIFITIHWVFFYASIKYSNISIGVVCYSLTGFFTAIFSPLVNGRKFSAIELLLSALTLFGISLIFHFDASYQLGIVLGVVSSALASLYTVYNEHLVKRYDSLVINYYQMITGTVSLGLLLPAYLHFFPSEQLIPYGRDTLYLLLLALFCTVVLYILFAESLKKIPAFTVSLSFNLEPIYSITIAFLFFNEGNEVNASFYAGCFCVMASVGLQTLLSQKR